MIKKKICLLGYYAVGKTSLTRRFVHETFDEKYHTTIGVKIDKKKIIVNNETIQMLIWDIHGEDRFQKVQKSYLIGASGYLLVVDATRAESVDIMLQLKKIAQDNLRDAPFLLLINKSDLVDEIVVTPKMLIDLGINAEQIISTSAKTGERVEEAFFTLACKLI